MKFVFYWILTLGLALGAASPSWAGQGIRIVGSDRPWPGFVRVEPDAMIPHAENFETLDPNFPEDGLTRFTGIRLSALLKIGGVEAPHGVTAIGSDQYVGYLPPRDLARGFLVWEMDGRPVSGLKGGPLKIVFFENSGIHASCYTWYVETLVAGPVKDAVLSVTIGGETREYRPGMMPRAVSLDPHLFSIAQGCRDAFKRACSPEHVRAVPLARLLPGINRDRIKSVGFIPFAGPGVTLGPEILDYPVRILTGCGDDLIHPALGGPFSVVFPVETHPELLDMVPESGALFFLEKIVVD